MNSKSKIFGSNQKNIKNRPRCGGFETKILGLTMKTWGLYDSQHIDSRHPTFQGGIGSTSQEMA